MRHTLVRLTCKVFPCEKRLLISLYNLDFTRVAILEGLGYILVRLWFGVPRVHKKAHNPQEQTKIHLISPQISQKVSFCQTESFVSMIKVSLPLFSCWIPPGLHLSEYSTRTWNLLHLLVMWYLKFSPIVLTHVLSWLWPRLLLSGGKYDPPGIFLYLPFRSKLHSLHVFFFF